MARQFKIEVQYATGFSSEIYWHDNDAIEFATTPPMMTSNVLTSRTDMLSALVNFCKEQKINGIECTRITPVVGE